MHTRSILAALCLVPVLALAVVPVTARADGGSAGAPTCDSNAVTACAVLDLSGGTIANLSAPTVNVYGYDLVQIGGTEVGAEASELHLHGDASVAVGSFGTVTVQATGDVSIGSVMGATVLSGTVMLGGCTLSVDGAGVVHCDP